MQQFYLKSLLFFISIAGLAYSSAGSGSGLDQFFTNQYEQLQPLEGVKPPYDLYKKGMVGYYNLKAASKKINNEKLTLIDFRLSSKKKRMWVIDLKTNKVLYYRLVAHGKNTGEEYARTFSNTRNSNQSSLGFYLTGENYIGKHGLSLRLDGLEPGFNDEARARAIVMHSANYVSREFINRYGRLGRSFGCPAIAPNKHKEIIKGLSNRSVVFIYAENERYKNSSLWLDERRALTYLQRINKIQGLEAAL